MKMLSRCQGNELHYRSPSHNILNKDDDLYNLRLHAKQICCNIVDELYDQELRRTQDKLFREIRGFIYTLLDGENTSRVSVLPVVSALSDIDTGNMISHISKDATAPMGGTACIWLESTCTQNQNSKDIIGNILPLSINGTRSDQFADFNLKSLLLSLKDESNVVVIVLKSCDIIDPILLSECISILHHNIMDQELSHSVTFGLLLVHTTGRPLHLPLRGKVLELVAVYPAVSSASPARVLDNFLTALLTSTRFPLILSLPILHWLQSVFSQHDKCLWSGVERLHTVICKHFDMQRCSLLSMYRNRLTSGHMTILEDREDRIRAIQDMLVYMSAEDLLSVHIPPVSSIPLWSKCDIIVNHLDFMSFRHWMDCCCLQLLMSIRNKFVPTSERDYYCAYLLWNEVVTTSGKDGRVLTSLFDRMATTLNSIPIKTVMEVFLHWGKILSTEGAVIDGVKYDLAESSDLHLCTAALNDIRNKHTSVLLLLQELVCILDNDITGANLSLLRLRSESPVVNASMSVEVNSEWIDPKSFDMKGIVERVLHEVCAWVSYSISLLTHRCPRAPHTLETSNENFLAGVVRVRDCILMALSSDHMGLMKFTRTRFAESLSPVDTALDESKNKYTSPLVIPDVSTLFSIVSHKFDGRKEFSVAEVFAEYATKFCANTNIEEITPARKKRKVAIRATSSVKSDNGSDDVSLNLHCHCRFVVALNELIRTGYLKLAASGLQIKRTMII